MFMEAGLLKLWKRSLGVGVTSLRFSARYDSVRLLDSLAEGYREGRREQKVKQLFVWDF